jgi:hypothetical protein
MRAMTDPVMTFATLDDAESALDWIGLEFADGDGVFDGELDEDAAALLDAALVDPETPLEVRALAATLREQWRDESAPRAWRVAYPA